MDEFRKIKVIKEFSIDVQHKPHVLKNEKFEVGEVYDVDIISENDDCYEEMQFENGDVIFNIPKFHFEEIK